MTSYSYDHVDYAIREDERCRILNSLEDARALKRLIAEDLYRLADDFAETEIDAMHVAWQLREVQKRAEKAATQFDGGKHELRAIERRLI